MYKVTLTGRISSAAIINAPPITRAAFDQLQAPQRLAGQELTEREKSNEYPTCVFREPMPKDQDARNDEDRNVQHHRRRGNFAQIIER